MEKRLWFKMGSTKTVGMPWKQRLRRVLLFRECWMSMKDEEGRHILLWKGDVSLRVVMHKTLSVVPKLVQRMSVDLKAACLRSRKIWKSRLEA